MFHIYVSLPEGNPSRATNPPLKKNTTSEQLMIFDKLSPKSSKINMCAPVSWSHQAMWKNLLGIELFAMENHGKSTISNG